MLVISDCASLSKFRYTDSIEQYDLSMILLQDIKNPATDEVGFSPDAIPQHDPDTILIPHEHSILWYLVFLKWLQGTMRF